MISPAIQSIISMSIDRNGMLRSVTFSEGCPLKLGSTFDAFSSGLYQRSTLQPIPYLPSSTLSLPLTLLNVDGFFCAVRLLSGTQIDAAAWTRRARARAHFSAVTCLARVLPLRRLWEDNVQPN